MRKRLKVSLATIIATGGMVGIAAPAAAAQEGNSGPWEMPDVRGEKLQRGIDTIDDLVGDFDLRFDIRNRLSAQEVINYTNWEICAQAPGAGGEITQKTKRVILVVRRPNTSGC